MILGATGFLPLWFLPVLLVALRWNGIIQHNHTHLPVFRSPLTNKFFGSVLTLVSAVPQPVYRYIHVEVHHRFLNSPRDWTGPFSHVGSSFPDSPTPFWRYCLAFTPRGWRRTIPILWDDPTDRRALLECALPIAVLVAALVVISPTRTALFVFLPWVATALFLPISNWLQHTGCSYESASTSANVNLGLFSRTMAFNIGYHSAHHARPAAHWSKLPDLHTRLLADSVPPARIRKSLTVDLSRTLVHVRQVLLPSPSPRRG
jgi:fatty acid desaturase